MKLMPAALGTVLVLTVVRLAVVWMSDPSPEEAYYLVCAERPEPAYFDGPAGTAGTARLIAGGGRPDVWWRLTAPLWTLAATGACFLLIRELAGAGRAAAVALLFNVLPAVNEMGVRAGPWMPALTFSMLAMLAAWHAGHAERRRLWWALSAGVFVGAATQFAYAAIFLAPALAVSLFCRGRKPGPDAIGGAVVAVGVPLLMLAPALRWNAAENWIPLAGGTFRTLWEFPLRGLLLALAGALFALSPLILPMLAAAWVACLRRWRGDIPARFAALCALPGIVLGTYWLLRGESAVFYFLTAAPLLLNVVIGGAEPGPRRILAAAAVGLAVVLSVFAAFRAAQWGRGWVAASADIRDRFLEQSAAEHEGIFLIAEDPGMASVLGHHLRNDLIPPPGHPIVYVRESQDIDSQFSLWPGYGDFLSRRTVNDGDETEEGVNPFIGRSALYITREKVDDVPQAIRAAFEAVTALPDVAMPGQDSLHIYLCVNYRTLPR